MRQIIMWACGTALLPSAGPAQTQEDYDSGNYMLPLCKAWLHGAIWEALPDANKRQPGEVLNFVLDAIRAHDAKMIGAAGCVEKPPENSLSDNQ